MVGGGSNQKSKRVVRAVGEDAIHTHSSEASGERNVWLVHCHLYFLYRLVLRQDVGRNILGHCFDEVSGWALHFLPDVPGSHTIQLSTARPPCCCAHTDED